jgi:hypothetical protein
MASSWEGSSADSDREAIKVAPFAYSLAYHSRFVGNLLRFVRGVLIFRIWMRSPVWPNWPNAASTDVVGFRGTAAKNLTQVPALRVRERRTIVFRSGSAGNFAEEHPDHSRHEMTDF